MPNTNHINRQGGKPKQEALIRLGEVKRLTGLSTSAIYRLIAEGRFPRQVSLGSSRSVGFVESEIAEWIQERIADRDNVEGGDHAS